MNMIAPGMNALATCEALTATDVYVGEDTHEKLVARLEEYVRALPKDMGTTKGRDEIRSLAAKVARTKTGLDELGKDYVADLKKQTGAVDTKRKLIRDRLDALRDEVRDPLTAFEEAETNRVSEHERLLTLLAGAAVFNTVPSLAEIDDRIAKLSPFATRDWEEFYDRAIEGIDDATNKLNGFRAAAVKQEADAAELIELRRAAAEQAARDVAARLEAEKADAARIAAEQEAARIAEAVEKARIAAERGAAAEIERAEAERLTAERALEAERIRAEQREKDALKAAEAAAAKAVEEERTRVAREEGDRIAAAAKLERNKKHRRKVHNEIVGFLMGDAGLSNDHAHSVVEQLVAGRIPHVAITY